MLKIILNVIYATGTFHVCVVAGLNQPCASHASPFCTRLAMERKAMESTSQTLRCDALLPSLAPLHRRSLPHSAPLVPLLSSCYLSRCAPGGGMPRWLSTQPPEMKGFKDYKLPPVNPPDKENPDATTLRAQWDNAVRLYGRMYSHAWGTAILAGVVLFGIGWWVKGESPLKALSPTGEIKKEETAE